MGNEENKIKVSVIEEKQLVRTDVDQAIFELNSNIEMLASHADELDYFVAIASGVLCGALDILWVGEFDLARGRNIASDKVEGVVKKIAKLLGCKNDDLNSAIRFLEKKFPLASDSNIADFGGSLQHHFRDFAHHPTIVGLIFSLLTQFTEMSYGTDATGSFKVVHVPEEKKELFIGKNVADKLFRGTVVWAFHLISDMAGSSGTGGLSGGTGIPGPILSLFKEISALPIFRNIKIGKTSLSEFLAKLFNGTLFAKRDKNGKIIKDTIIKFDLRGEIGLGLEIGRQATPVIANDCIVRSFYLIRRFGIQIKRNKIKSIKDFSSIDWNDIKPYDNPTIDRMLLIATGVFTTIDITEAVASEKWFLSVNYIGVGRFVVALGKETVNYLKLRDVKKIKAVYEEVKKNTFTVNDSKIMEFMDKIDLKKLALSDDHIEILFNIEDKIVVNDINNKETNKELKMKWRYEWRDYVEKSYYKLTKEKKNLNWYKKDILIKKIRQLKPQDPWFKIVLLEAISFMPYFTLNFEIIKDKVQPDKEYIKLIKDRNKYKSNEGVDYIEDMFRNKSYYEEGLANRLLKTYEKARRKLNIIAQRTKGTIGGVMGAYFVLWVISFFICPPLSAPTSTSLVGAGIMVPGGGSAILAFGSLLSAGNIAAETMLGKNMTLYYSAELVVTLKEIILNEYGDINYATSIYETFVDSVRLLEESLKSMEDDDRDRDQKEKYLDLKDSLAIMKKAEKQMKKDIINYRKKV